LQAHRFIRRLEVTGRLLKNYTQNIDTLEQVAGIEKVINCHGSFNTAACLVCTCSDCDLCTAIPLHVAPVGSKANDRMCPLRSNAHARSDPTAMPAFPMVFVTLARLP
jgi:hypothetical protein